MSKRRYLRRRLVDLLEPYYVSRIQKLPKKPDHVAIIMDGNGRWAKLHGLPRIKGHVEAVSAVRRVVQACVKVSIRHLSLFAFSTENWKRPEDEVNSLMNLFVEQINKNLEEMKRNGVRVWLVGRRKEIFPETLRAFERAEEETQNNSKLNLYMLVNYSGRAELVDALKKIVTTKNGEIKDITEETIRNYLYVPDAPFPDLIIRTSGEMRLSNFYLWQAAYSEFYFDPVLWPDYDKLNFYKALIEYSRRKRRFGGLEEF